MITRLTEEEREIWKDIYTIHEQYHDMPLTADGFVALRNSLAKMCNKANLHPLAEELALALFNYFDLLFQADRKQGEQLTMEAMR